MKTIIPSPSLTDEKLFSISTKSSDLQWWLRDQKSELSFPAQPNVATISSKRLETASSAVRMRTGLPPPSPLHILLLLFPPSSLPHTNPSILPRFHKSSLLLAVSQVRHFLITATHLYKFPQVFPRYLFSNRVDCGFARMVDPPIWTVHWLVAAIGRWTFTQATNQLTSAFLLEPVRLWSSGIDLGGLGTRARWTYLDCRSRGFCGRPSNIICLLCIW